MIKRTFIMSLALILVGLAAAPSLAFWGMPAGRQNRPQAGRPGQLESRIISRLNLTAEQKDNFLAANEKLRAAVEEKMKAVKSAADQLRAELRKDEPDKNIVHEQVKQIDALRTEIQLLRLDSLLELKKGLTPDQRREFDKMLDHRGRPEEQR